VLVSTTFSSDAKITKTPRTGWVISADWAKIPFPVVECAAEPTFSSIFFLSGVYNWAKFGVAPHGVGPKIQNSAS